jgi:hypothetical protein
MTGYQGSAVTTRHLPCQPVHRTERRPIIDTVLLNRFFIAGRAIGIRPHTAEVDGKLIRMPVRNVSTRMFGDLLKSRQV